jgi:phage shock protein PspC (stress-responsive transcriptional regulator)
MRMKKLYRSRTHRVLGGVFGGLGEIYAVDPTMLRLIYALLAVLTGFVPLTVLYLIAWAIIPEEANVVAR